MGTKREKREVSNGGVAAALIAAAQARTSTKQLPELAVEDVREICAYNDTVPLFDTQRRVSIATMRETLKAHYGWIGGEKALNAACRAQLGRKSFARA